MLIEFWVTFPVVAVFFFYVANRFNIQQVFFSQLLLPSNVGIGNFRFPFIRYDVLTFSTLARATFMMLAVLSF